MYVVFGTNGKTNKPSRTILWTRPLPNGHLEPWRESQPYPGQGLEMCTAVATPGYIHIIGGRDHERAVRAEVWTAKLAADGSVLGWEQGTTLPQALWFHASAVAGGRVWTWGGLKSTNVVINEKVFSAPILSSGKVGEWAYSGSSLPRPFYDPAVCVSGNILLSFCPRYASGQFSNDIWFAEVKENGTLSPWTSLNTDMGAKMYTGVATDYRRNLVYLPGGRINRDEKEGSLDGRVYYYRLMRQETAEAKPGGEQHPASGDQNLSYARQGAGYGSVFPGFLAYEYGRQMARDQSKPMVLYFHSDIAAKCRQQAEILKVFNAGAYAGRLVLTDVNIRDFPQIAQQYGVFRAPCWLFFNAGGQVVGRQNDILSAEALQAGISNLVR